jgi:hypothetical protein
LETLDFTTTEIQTAPGSTVTEDVRFTKILTVVDSVTVSPVSTVLLATVVYLTTTETQTAAPSTVTDNAACTSTMTEIQTAPPSTVTDNIVSTLTQDVSNLFLLSTIDG